MENKPNILITASDLTKTRDIQQFLEAAMYKTEAQRIDRAMLYALEQKPDLILIDIQSKNFDYCEFCRQIKSDLSLKKTAIVLCGERDDLVRIGNEIDGIVEGFFCRPISYQELLSLIKAHLRYVTAEKALKMAEERYRLLYESAPLGYQSLDKNGKILDINQVWLEIFGFDRQEVIGRWFGDFLAPQQRSLFETRFPNFKKSGEMRNAEFEMVHKNGSHKIVSFDGRIGYDETMQFKQIHCILNDVTERNQAEKEVLRLNRVYAVISQINQMVVRTRIKDEILANACRIAVEFGKFRMAWIGMLDHEKQIINPVAWAGFEEGYFNQIIRRLGYEGFWSTNTAIQAGKPIYTNSIANEPGNDVWRDEAVRRGYYSSISLPMFVNNTFIGAFTIFSSEENFFTEPEIQLLEEVTNDISYAFELIESDENRKRAEEALRRSEQKYRRLNETMMDGFVYVDMAGAIQDCNESYRQMFGYSYTELRQLTYVDLTPEKWHSFEQKIVAEQILVRGYSDIYEKEYRRKNGEIFPVELRTYLIKNERGENEGMWAIVRDITARKRAEESLRGANYLLQQVVDGSASLIYIIDKEGRFLLANTRLATLLGTTPDQVKGKTRSNFLPVEYAQLHRNNDLTVIKTGKTIALEEENLENDGMHIYYSVKYPLYDTSGQIYAIGGISTDITERKRIEYEFQHLNIELEQRVEDRTRELQEAQEKLVRQEKLAVLGQLAGGVGHELRNPLGIIKNAVYFLRLILPNQDKKVNEYFEMIESEINIADKIINDLLNFSRVKSNELESVPVHELLERVMERYPAPEGIRVIRKIPDHMPDLHVDPQQIVQVLGNLVINAYQAMPNGGEITLLGAVSNNEIMLSVQDCGIGIPKENIKKIFEPLFTTKTKGIGLGLAVSKKVIESNGGRIEVQSEAGVGSSFTIYLPI